jgi:serine/threonine protein kinase
MTCLDIGEFEELTANEVDPGRAAKLRDHISGCPACSKREREISQNLELSAVVRRAVTDSSIPVVTPTHVGIYRILREIGRGGMGVVYEAEDPTLDRRIALKLLRTDSARLDEDRVSRFRQEAQLLASLNHPNLATVYSLEHSDGLHFLTMEIVPGENLARRIQDRTLPIESALLIVRQIGKALEVAHDKGIIHRDLKPHNVMAPEHGPVKVLDFGIAKAFGQDPEPGVSEVSGRAGTPGFMSPEQLRNSGTDHRADIWSLGCILFECLTGRRPFDGETPAQRIEATLRGEVDWDLLPESLPERIGELIRNCLATDPRQRPQKVTDVVVTLESELARPVFLGGYEAIMPGGEGNLPHRVSSFVGRARETDDLRERIGKNRLVSWSRRPPCGSSFRTGRGWSNWHRSRIRRPYSAEWPMSSEFTRKRTVRRSTPSSPGWPNESS